MDAGLVVQYVIIALAVVLSAAYVVRRQWPGVVRRVRGAVALWLMRDIRAPWMRAVGRRIAPPARVGSATGCATSCGGGGPSH